ncbi:MAG: glycoside hydrolase family 3 C-terminal domain-containing protein, partial [Clostridia bacterium]|nr:glycoside hydrolase family 3 C-terminal domain-containing protein [Clostridia bacterium]
RGGIRWTFAPMVDICRDPRWGRIAEGYGEDTYLCSRLAEAAVKGYQGDGLGGKDRVLACMKHFIAYSACIGGRDYDSADLSMQTIHDVYLPPFIAGIQAGVATFMSAFEDVNGVPATANRYLLTELLREQLGFKGFVVSDAGGVKELIPHGFAEGPSDAVEKAFTAGVDMIMSGDFYNENLPALVEAGKVSMEQIDTAVLRILTLKYACGLVDDPLVDEAGEEVFFHPDHIDAAYRAAVKTFVLLENNGILPLKTDTKKIALIGPYADDAIAARELLGTWASMCDPAHTVCLADGLRTALPQAEITTARGCDFHESDNKDADDRMFAQAVETAKGADVVIVAVGEEEEMSGEASSITDIRLTGRQEALIDAAIETGHPVIVLVAASRPMVLTHFNKRVDALMMIWNPGTAAGNAVADVLVGKHSPSGHLTTSFPVTVGQLPIYYNHFNTGRPTLGKWKFEAKYRDCQVEPLYPFGYGLSYTDFSFENIRLSADTMPIDGQIDVTVTVKNNGKTAGATVVQMYVRDLIGSRVRPVKELKGFKRVFLQAGESQTITLPLPADALAFHNPAMERVVEPGTFKLWIAQHAQDNSNETTFKVI